MKASRSPSGIDGWLQADLAGRLRPADLATDLVTDLLAQGREVLVEGRLRRQERHRADVLALDVERPAAVDLARPEGARQGVGRGVAAAQAPQVHDVPGLRVLVVIGRRRGQVGGHRVRHGREVVRRRQHGRVVGVVAGAHEDRLGVRRDRGQLLARIGPHVGRGDRVAQLDLVAVHERDDRDRGSVRRGVGGHDHQGLLVGVVAVGVPPGPVEGPAAERGRPGGPVGERVPGCRVDQVEWSADGAQRRRVRRRAGRGRAIIRRAGRGAGREVDRLRTGRLHAQGGAGHRAEDSTGRGGRWLRAQPPGGTAPAVQDGPGSDGLIRSMSSGATSSTQNATG